MTIRMSTTPLSQGPSLKMSLRSMSFSQSVAALLSTSTVGTKLLSPSLSSKTALPSSLLLPNRSLRSVTIAYMGNRPRSLSLCTLFIEAMTLTLQFRDWYSHQRRSQRGKWLWRLVRRIKPHPQDGMSMNRRSHFVLFLLIFICKWFTL